MHRHVAMPRYLVLADAIRARIEEGVFRPGDRLPSESELCREHGVSRGTVVRAIERLVGDGIVNRRQGSGSFVARPSLHRRAGSLLSFSETAAGEGHRSTQRLISIGSASTEQARAFDCSAPAVSLCRLRLIDGVPCALHRSLVPERVTRRVAALCGEDDDALRAPAFSLYQALDAAGFAVHEAQERVTTRLADTEEIALLRMGDPAAVMVVFRKSFDERGYLVEAVEAVHRADSYTYDMRLVRADLHRAPARTQTGLSPVGRSANS